MSTLTNTNFFEGRAPKKPTFACFSRGRMGEDNARSKGANSAPRQLRLDGCARICAALRVAEFPRAGRFAQNHRASVGEAVVSAFKNGCARAGGCTFRPRRICRAWMARL